MEEGFGTQRNTIDTNITGRFESFFKAENKKYNIYACDCNVNKCKYKPKEVISSVVSAVQIMQNADKVTDSRKNSSLLKEFKQSTFWPVSTIPSEPSAIETKLQSTHIQNCGPETQNMVEQAQILTQLISHQGVTQEFDTSFTPETKIGDHKNEHLTISTIAVNSVNKNDINNVENRLLYDNEHKYLEEIQFLPTQILKSNRKDVTPMLFSNENYRNVVNSHNNDSNKILSQSSQRKFMEHLDLVPTQIIIKKDDSGGSRLNTLTYEKNTESFESNTIVNLNVIPSENKIGISDKCPILNSQKCLTSNLNKQNMNENLDPNILSKHFFQRFDDNCGNSPIDLENSRHHSPSLSSSPINLTCDLKSFERFENLVHPIVHKYTTFNDDLKAEIASKYLTLPEVEESIAKCSCQSVEYQISCDSNLDPSSNSVSDQHSIQSQQENCCLQDCKLLWGDTELNNYHDSKLTFNAYPSKCFKRKIENIILEHHTNHKYSSEMSEKLSEIQTSNSTYSTETKNISTMNTTQENRSFDSPVPFQALQPSIDYIHNKDKGIEIDTDKNEFSAFHSNKKYENLEELKERNSPQRSNSTVINKNPLIIENKNQEIDIFDDMFDTEDFSLTEIMKMTVEKNPDECALPDSSCSNNNIILNENLPNSTNGIDKHNLYNNTCYSAKTLQPTLVDDFKKKNASSNLLSEKQIISDKHNTENVYNNEQVYDNMCIKHIIVTEKSKQQSEAEVDIMNKKDMTSSKLVDRNIDDYNLFKSDQHCLRFATASNKKVEILKNVKMKKVEPNKKWGKDNLGLSLNYNNNCVEKKQDLSVFGYSTVVNKEVEISEVLLDTLNTTPAFEGFLTASNKPVGISGEALQISKNMFENWESGENHPPNRKNHVHSDHSNEMPVFLGFQTASKEKTEISKNVLQETKEMFENLASHQHDSIKVDKNVDVEQFHKAQSFVTGPIANNKKIGISANNFEKNKNMLLGRENGQDNQRKPKNDVGHIEKSNKISGFQTASKKNVEISEEALQRSKALFQSWDKEHDGLFDTEKNVATNVTTPTYVRFQTASNKDVEITEAALQKSKRLLENSNIENFKLNSEKEAQSGGNVCLKNKRAFVGFQTASNKKVNVTDKALKRPRRLFQNCESNGNDLNLNNENLQKIVKADNFVKQKKVSDSTIIEISEDTLTESQNIFHDLTNKKNCRIRENLKKISSNALDVSNKLEHSINNLESLLDPQEYDNFYETDCTSESHKITLQTSNSPTLLCSNENPRKKPIKKIAERSNMNTGLKNLIDTQLSKNFDQTLNTEDFHDNTPTQRITSPTLEIISPRPKRKKLFKTAYCKAAEVDKAETGVKINNETKTTMHNFKSDYKKFKNYSLNDLQFKNNSEQQLTINTDLDGIINCEETCHKIKTPFAKTKNNQDKVQKCHNYVEHSKQLNKTPPFLGIPVPSTKKVEISEKALHKTEMMFRKTAVNLNNAPKSENKVEGIAPPNDEPNFVCFQTANNKKIHVSEEVLQKTNNMFRNFVEGLENVQKSDYNKKCTEQPNITPAFVGFQTASKKKVEISEESLQRTKALFQRWDKEHDGPFETENIFATNVTTPTYVRFQTASNKDVEITEAALQKSKRLLENSNIEEFKLNSEKEAQSEGNVCKKNKRTFVGFQTASNKKVNVTEKALKRSRRLFQNFESNENDLNLNYENSQEIVKADNFVKQKKVPDSTITVNVSEDNLTKSQSVFQDFKNKKTNDTRENLKKTGSNALQLSTKIDHSINNLESLLDPQAYDIIYETDSTSESHKITLQTSNSPTLPCSKANPRKKPIKKIAERSNMNTGLKNLIDTQLSKNFDQTLNTEDFHDNTPTQRITSPTLEIISPRPKRKKLFKTAYYKAAEVDKAETGVKINNETKTTMHNFKSDYKKFKNYSLNDLQFKNNSEQQLTINTDLDGIINCEETCHKIKTPFAKTKNNQDKVQKCHNYVEHSKQLNKTPPFLGIPVPSNKKVEISEKALHKTEMMFRKTAVNLNNAPKSENKVEGIAPPNDEQNFVCFQTANNKKIHVSEEALQKTNNMFRNFVEGLENVQKSDYNINCTEQPNITPAFVGFQTASKKKVEISEESLQRTKALFQRWDKEHDGPFETEKFFATNVTTPTYVRFQTASNKDVEITEDALQKSKRLLENSNIEKFKLNSEKEAQSEENVCKKNKRTFVGFQTASNKKVNVTEKALKRSRRLFQNFESNGNDLNLNYENSQEIVKADNFVKQKKVPDSTITVKVSEDTSTESQGVFQDFKNKKTNDTRENLKKTGSNALQLSTKIDHSINNLESLLDPQAYDIIYETDSTSESHKITLQTSNSPTLPCSKANPRKKVIKKSTECSNMNTGLKNLIDTQVSKHFDQTLNTEDFHDNTPTQRITSPTLEIITPRPKRKKLFTTPYSKAAKVDKAETGVKIKNETKTIIYNFKSDYKKIKKYSLNDLQFKNNSEQHFTINIDLDDIMNFEFDETRNNLMETKMKVENLKIIFSNSPDINSNIVPEGWIENHLKLISWKLISYELKYCYMENVFNVTNVLDQLKYRYDRELYHFERPALRKILEKDDASTRTLVLCVMKIICNGNISDQNSSVELELTDGWYTVKAVIDNLLKGMVSKGTIKVGTKIMTQGAELINCGQGISPWEDMSSVRLKIYGNSTRRVRWYTRLGFHGNAAMLLPLSSVSEDGGKVSKIKVFVARVYPLLYMEKFDDGRRVTRSERLEHLYEAKYEKERQLILEKIYDEVEKEFMDRNSMDYDDVFRGQTNNIKMEIHSQIANCVKKLKHSAESQECLTETQKDFLMQYKLEKEEMKLRDLQKRVQEKIENSKCCFNRNVVALLKVRVVDVRIQNGQTVTSRGLLSVWNVNESVMDVLKEGRWVEAFNVTPTGMRGTEVMISANRHSIFNKSRIKDEKKIHQSIEELSRKYTPIHEIWKNSQRKMQFNEIDTVGLIFAVDPTVPDFQKQSNSNVQKLYLADEMKNIICINFWGGLQKYGLEGFIDIGQFVYCMNLQKSFGTANDIPQFRATEFSCFTKIPKNNQSKIVYEELRKKFTSIDISKFCEECSKLKNCCFTTNNIVARSPYAFNNNKWEGVLNESKFTNVVPKGKNVECEQMVLDLTESDFECSFDDMENMCPTQIVVKKRLSEKLQKLRMYEEPPKLSPIVINNKSSNANCPFRSPLSNNVAMCNTTVNRIDVNNTVTPKNVNFTSCVHKSAVNRIKLDSPTKCDTSIGDVNLDALADEFYASPPLSCDSFIF